MKVKCQSAMGEREGRWVEAGLGDDEEVNRPDSIEITDIKNYRDRLSTEVKATLKKLGGFKLQDGTNFDD